MKTKEELLAQRNTPNFRENTDIVKKKKFNLETDYYTTKTALCVSQGTAPEVGLGGWVTGYGHSLGWTWTHKFLSKELESPRPGLWKQLRFKKLKRNPYLTPSSSL